MARTSTTGAKGVSAFIVDANEDGISYGKNEHKMGWKNQPTAAVHFTDVKVPAENLLGEEGQGLYLCHERLGRRAYQYRHVCGGYGQAAP